MDLHLPGVSMSNAGTKLYHRNFGIKLQTLVLDKGACLMQLRRL